MSGFFKPRQLKLRAYNGEYAIDLKAAPLSQLLAVATALDQLQHEQDQEEPALSGLSA